MSYGVCKVCGCTDNDPCHHPYYGMCWWVDDTHELCSHCANKEIAEDQATQHCINSNGFDLFPGIKRKDLAAIGENIRREGQVYQAELEERQRLGLHGEDAIRHYNEWMKKYGMEHLMVKEG